GIIANTRGNLEQALQYYQTSLGVYRALELDDYVAFVLNNIAMAYMKLERWTEAEAVFEEALAGCDAAGDLANKLLVTVNSVQMWIARGDLARAERLCEVAVAGASEAGDRRVLDEALKHRGTIARKRRSEEHTSELQSLAYLVCR